MTDPASSPTAARPAHSDTVRVALVLLVLGFVLTAIGSVWTILTPIGTGVNFPAGLLYLLGLTVGVLGVVFGVVAFVIVSKAGSPR